VGRVKQRRKSRLSKTLNNDQKHDGLGISGPCREKVKRYLGQNARKVNREPGHTAARIN
jgi:hypothetical protein